jgi:hypothetical protein
MPRPTINEDLAVEVRRIHTQTHGKEAGSFQEALDTVVQLAQENQPQGQQQTEQHQGWYPGKYASNAIKTVVNDIKTDARRTSQSTSEDQIKESHQSVLREPKFAYDPAAGMAIFKVRLGDDRSITVPEPEVDALEIEAGDLLQMVAYPWNSTDE